MGSNISFVNESQFLIISNASVDDLLEKINDSKHSINALSFRFFIFIIKKIVKF